jgi:hypothetical protein
MTFEKDVDLLTRYNTWKGEKKVKTNDYSPEAFVVDEAKESAYKRVEEAIKYLRDEANWDQQHRGVVKLLKILED